MKFEVKSDLDLLIEYYETEKQSLEKIIQSCLRQREYMGAHYNLQALYEVNRQLILLNGFKGPLYAEQQNLEHYFTVLSELDDPTGRQERHLLRKIEEQKEKVQQLSAEATSPFYDSQVIDDALFDLADGKISNFNIIFFYEYNGYSTENMGESFVLNFKISPQLILEISTDLAYLLNQRGYNEESFFEEPLNPFKGLGFDLDENGDQLIWRCNMKNFKSAVEIKTMLARCIYNSVVGGFNNAKLQLFINKY